MQPFIEDNWNAKVDIEKSLSLVGKAASCTTLIDTNLKIVHQTVMKVNVSKIKEADNWSNLHYNISK